MSNEIEIFKEPVLYMIVTRCLIINSDETFIHAVPVVMNTCDYPDSQDINGDTINLEKSDVVLGVIPAPIGMMQVSVYLPGKNSPTRKRWAKELLLNAHVGTGLWDDLGRLK